MKKVTRILFAFPVLVAFLGYALPAEAASVVVSVPETNSLVKAGQRVYFEIDFLYPDNTSRRDFSISYAVKEGDEVLASAKIIKAVETQASFVDYAVVPMSASKGLHTIDVTITDNTGKTVASNASASFEVESNYNSALIHFYILLAAVLGVGMVIMLQIRHAVWRVMRGAR